MENKKDMQYYIDSIDLTEEELRKHISNKNYDIVIRSFSKAISKYTKGYDEDLKQELYVALIEKCESKNITKWKNIIKCKNYLYGFIKRYAEMMIKYKYKYGNLSRRETDRYLELYHKETKTHQEDLELELLEQKWNRNLPIHHLETTDCMMNVYGNSYEMQIKENNLIEEIKKVLTDLEFYIFYMNTVMDNSLREIASQVNMSHENVANIIKKCKEKLKNNINIQKFL